MSSGRAPFLAIETQNLRKVFRNKVAVRNLSLSVRQGAIFGFLGPNGAGKSTSIKMLLGLVRPTSGQARVLGASSNEPDVRRKIGFLPEDFRIYDWLTASELLHLHGRLSGIPEAKLRERVPEMLELVSLTPHRSKRLHGFSKGMLQRVGLAQALIHKPELIFLDEPTSGLDPMGRRLVRDLIRVQRERGATVFLNSHFLSEVEVTCDEVAFIKDGEIVGSHNLHALAAGEMRISVRAQNVSKEALTGLRAWATLLNSEGEHYTFTTSLAEYLPVILRHLVASGASVYQFTPERLSLEDLFMRTMGEDRGL